MNLTVPQALLFNAWVTDDGGNLIAMRPDKKLAILLGLTDQSSTRTNNYPQVNTGSTPGAGIVGAPLHFHGVADNYSRTADTGDNTEERRAGQGCESEVR